MVIGNWPLYPCNCYTSFQVSFFTGLLFLEPFKVLLLACFISWLCKGVDLDDDDVDDDEEKAVIADESEWYKESRRGKGIKLDPIDEEYLEIIRIARQKEVEMWSIVKELIGYFFFIVIMYIISYGNRDPLSYLFQENIRMSFIDRYNYSTVVTSNDWWDWANSGIVDQLRAQNYYNGQPPYGLRGFIGDKTNRIMGYGILRQVRVKPNSCRVDSRVRSVTQECAQASALINEDSRDYCDAWEEMNNLTKNLPSCFRPEFKYTKAEDLDSSVYSAKVDSYDGGGYVYRLDGQSRTIRQGLVELQQQHWVNNHTRAIFLEFSVYNANVNLFAICTIVAEFIPGGGIIPYWRFDIVRLLHHHEKLGTFLVICEVIFLFYLIYFIVKQIYLMKKLKKEYWKDNWIIAEWAVISLSIVAIFFYAYRAILTNEILQTFQDTNGNGYMNLQHVGKVDELYGYMVGLILFVANVKFIKLLRFNNLFEILLSTLRVCWEDLSGFLAVFFLLFLAFVQLFYMILHKELREFSSQITTLETCFTMLLNRFKFGAIRETSFTASVMFFCFAISCSFILINVLLTIIIESFEKVGKFLFRIYEDVQKIYPVLGQG